MQVFLGDVVTLTNSTHDDDFPTFVTGQIKGIKLNESRQLHAVWLHNIDQKLEIGQGWKFVDSVEEEEEDD